ncbi:hypothetical protein GCM10020221_30870 [Streptomyces thioluteus]|uniref:Monooxygenase n=1 Tax=Streptomyces thioluteus TaxID=66431 RepID=A0ABN3X186_STRTU
MFGTFCDIAVDPPPTRPPPSSSGPRSTRSSRTRRPPGKLTPTEFYAKRPICNAGYYETYNRPNVSLVGIKENPIVEITPRGVVTADGVEHELDVLVFATGFEAVEGSYHQIDIRGRGGESIRQHWADGPSTYLASPTPDSPNLFMVPRPQQRLHQPAARHRGPTSSGSRSSSGRCENGGTLLDRGHPGGGGRLDGDCREIAEQTLFAKIDVLDLRGQTSPARRSGSSSTSAGSAPTARSCARSPLPTTTASGCTAAWRWAAA